MKLTKAQERVLRELAKPGARALLMAGLDVYWFVSGSMKQCTPTVEALIKRKLLTVTKKDCFGRSEEAIINTAGRAWLDAHKQSQGAKGDEIAAGIVKHPGFYEGDQMSVENQIREIFQAAGSVMTNIRMVRITEYYFTVTGAAAIQLRLQELEGAFGRGNVVVLSIDCSGGQDGWKYQIKVIAEDISND